MESPEEPFRKTVHVIILLLIEFQNLFCKYLWYLFQKLEQMISLFASRRLPASYHRSGHFMISKRFESAVMASKIGVPVLTKELPELYESGQYFINPQFGYRGVVLFPQQVRVLHDKQLSTDSVRSPSALIKFENGPRKIDYRYVSR